MQERPYTREQNEDFSKKLLRSSGFIEQSTAALLCKKLPLRNKPAFTQTVKVQRRYNERTLDSFVTMPAVQAFVTVEVRPVQ
eukprot:6209563-Pleurochrysis_carterae.AAC.1